MAFFVLAERSAIAEQPRLPPADPYRILTFQEEDDIIGNTDRYYTSGERVGITLPTGELPVALSGLGHALFGAGQQRLEFGLTQLMFTPRNKQSVPPNPNDRPYSALLLGDLSLIQDTMLTRTMLSAQLGVIGPAALGREIQNQVHRLIGDETAKGWGYQLPNQPVVELYANRIWRIPTVSLGPFQTDALPEVQAGIGTFRDYAMGGLQVRVGQGLDSDFGVPRNRPGLSGGYAYTTVRPFAWYLFAGGDVQAVGFDETINGEPFRNTAHVSLIPFIGSMEFGAAVIVHGVRVTFADVFQTHKFHDQIGSLFDFASVALSFQF